MALSRTLAIGLLLLLTCCRSRIDALGIRLPVEKLTLSNGLTVLLVEDPSVPIVSFQTWIHAGSVNELPGKTGISHLLEHLMFKGTARFGAGEFFQRLETRGAEVNAFTTRDYTVFHENCVPELLPQVIEMEADRLVNLKLSAELLGNERMVVFEERRLRMENAPESRLLEALWALAYRSHPYQWPVIGTPADLLSLSIEDVSEHYRRYYRPSNVALIVVGRFSRDQTLEQIRRHYGAIPAAPAPTGLPQIPDEPEQLEERRLVLRDPVIAERLAMAWHISSARDDDSFALDVLASILFDGESSPAHQELIEKRRLAVSVGGTAFTPAWPGLFVVNVMMKGGQTAESAEPVILDLIRSMETRPVSAEEIKRAVRQLTVQLTDSVRTPQGLGQMLGIVQLIFDDPSRFARDLDKYFSVTEADLHRVASRYFSPNNRTVVLMKPAKVAPGKDAPRRGDR